MSVDPFNIAPRAPRHSTPAWAILVLGCAALTYSLWGGSRAYERYSVAQDAYTLAREQQARHKEEVERAARAQRSPKSQERAKIEEEIRRDLDVSWAAALDAVESAVKEADGGISVLSLSITPGVADRAGMRITALAQSEDGMLQYVSGLAGDARLTSVQLTSQRLDAASPGAVKFELALRWNPDGYSSHLPELKQVTLERRRR